MDHNWPRLSFVVVTIISGKPLQAREAWEQVIEVTELNFEVGLDLRGHLEVAMASEATKMVVGCNMGLDTRVIKVTDVKSDVI